MIRELKRGEGAWLARVEPDRVHLPCPVCFGERSVTVVLGDGTEVRVRCETCGLGWEGPQGIVSEYVHRADPRRVTVAEVRVEERNGEREARYVVRGEGFETWCEPEDLFDDEESCRARAAEKAEVAAAAEEERSRSHRRRSTDHLSWSVGYHLREAKKAREEAARHEARATVLRKRAAPVAPAETDR